MKPGTPWAASWKQGDSDKAPEMTILMVCSGILPEKWDLGRHFGSPVDIEGGPKIAFSIVTCEKKQKKGLHERILNKH